MTEIAATEALAAALRNLKHRKGRSYEALARRAGVSKSALHRYVSGDALPGQLSVVELVARECDATATEIAELRQLWITAMQQRPTADESVSSDRDAGTSATYDLRVATLVAPSPPVATFARWKSWRFIRSALTMICVAAASSAVTVLVVKGSDAGTNLDVRSTATAGASSYGETCEPRAGVKHIDSRRSGHIWRTDYVCPNKKGAGLYSEPGGKLKVAVMETDRSWFACWIALPTSRPGIWYYSRGDHAEPGAEQWDGWGFVSAADVMLDAHPFPAMPECWFAATIGTEPVRPGG